MSFKEYNEIMLEAAISISDRLILLREGRLNKNKQEIFSEDCFLKQLDKEQKEKVLLDFIGLDILALKKRFWAAKRERANRKRNNRKV